VRPLLFGLALIVSACSPPVADQDSGATSIWIAYAQRGKLYRVRADGSEHARLRTTHRRAALASDPDVKLYDVWNDPVPRPGAETIAVIRGRNISFHVHPGAAADFDQSWDLVLVDPSAPGQDRVIYTSRRQLRRPRWSDDGSQLLAGVGRRDLVVWNRKRCRVHRLTFPVGEPKRPRLLLADFTRDGTGVHVLMGSYLDAPYMIGTAKLSGEELRVVPAATFRSFKMPESARRSVPAQRLLGHGVAGSALRLPFQVTPDRRYSFYFRKRDGWFARGWIEGVDADDGSTFEVRTLSRGLYVE